VTMEGELERLPLEVEEVDTVFISQALHHASQPDVAIREAARILRPGGLLVVLDLAAHEQEWVREQYADLWLGFAPERLCEFFVAAGLEPLERGRLPGATPELPVLLTTAVKPTP